MERVYIYTDRASKEVLFVAEAVDQRVAEGLVTAEATRRGLKYEEMKPFMTVQIYPVLKERKA